MENIVKIIKEFEDMKHLGKEALSITHRNFSNYLLSLDEGGFEREEAEKEVAQKMNLIIQESYDAGMNDFFFSEGYFPVGFIRGLKGGRHPIKFTINGKLNDASVIENKGIHVVFKTGSLESNSFSYNENSIFDIEVNGDIGSESKGAKILNKNISSHMRLNAKDLFGSVGNHNQGGELEFYVNDAKGKFLSYNKGLGYTSPRARWISQDGWVRGTFLEGNQRSSFEVHFKTYSPSSTEGIFSNNDTLIKINNGNIEIR